MLSFEQRPASAAGPERAPDRSLPLTPGSALLRDLGNAAVTQLSEGLGVPEVDDCGCGCAGGGACGG